MIYTSYPVITCIFHGEFVLRTGTPPPSYKGGGVDGTPSQGFSCFSIFRKDFAFDRKLLMCSTRGGLYYGLRPGAGENTPIESGTLFVYPSSNDR